MVPGFTHTITDLCKTENIVKAMRANDIFDRYQSEIFIEKI